ncbi:glycosyltransferase, partial [Gottfriedia acidiceleris]|uniref:glycosyltransferase n=1 Tax=Gottfriedia acidiceleris TaxID=371036 RepID=UPI002FFE658D
MTVYSLSVILINFNNEMFIKDTIESVINQRMNNLELIIVDDGSTDGSLEISRNFTERHSNVKLISQKNSGPSAARNTGIKEATGKYITFLDSDDLAIKGAYEKLLAIANENDADTAIGNFICFNDLKKWRLAYMGKVFKKNLPSIRHVRKNSELHFTPAVWNKLYKREFILQKNIQFDESLRIGEDLLFTEKSLLLSNKTVVKDIDIIQYRVNDLDSSLVKKVSLSFFEQLLKTQKELTNLYNELELMQEIKTIENRQFRFFFDSIY